jgi:hypothetical protein
LDDARSEFELLRIDSHRRIMALVDAIPAQSIPAALMERIEAQHRETVARESQMLNVARPEWADPKYSEAAWGRMTQLAARYGFTKTEARSVLDHRQILLLQDFANTLDRLEKLKAQARRQLEQPGALVNRETSGAAVQGQQGRRASNAQATQAQRVAQLISRRR